MLSSSKYTSATAAMALVIGLLVTASPALAAGPDVLPFVVTNDSGRPEQVYLYTVGVDIASDRLGSVNQAGVFTPWPAGSNPPVPAPDVSIAGPSSGGQITIGVPKGFSGRMYMSFGEKLDFRLTPDGLVQPAPWSPGDPNADILFDWSEFTYVDAGLYLNSSQVDMFAVPHAVTVTGSDGQTSRAGQLVDNGRNNVIDQIRSQPGWENSIITRSDGTVLRVLAPGKAADVGALSPTYLDPYITDAWNAYATKTLTVQPFADQPAIQYFGRTTGQTMRFTNASGQEVATFDKPTTANVWGCDGALGAPNDLVVGPIARTLCAALHRSTLGRIDTQPGGGPEDFYHGALTNFYSKFIHQNMVDGRAYGFAFDDVQAQESLVHSDDPVSAGINLTPFGAGGSTPPPSGGGGQLVSALNGKCIDVPNFDFSDGRRLGMWTCTDGSNQQWHFSAGTLQTQNGLCMDAAGAGTANGTPIQIASCNGGDAQQFVLTDTGDLVNPRANRCVDIVNVNPADDALLQLWDCAGTPNQKWVRA